MEDLEEAILTGLVFPIEPKCTQSMIHKSTLLNNHSKEEGGIWPTHPPFAPLGHRRAKRAKSAKEARERREPNEPKESESTACKTARLAAQIPEPRIQSLESRALGSEPRAQSPEPRTQSPGLRA